MNYRTLLVHLDDSSHSDARVEFALDLARKDDAHLIRRYAFCRQDLVRPVFTKEPGARACASRSSMSAKDGHLSLI
ncbi:universal stress protein family protein [Paraburkholderia sp. BL10I2N1]|nr:hypothetical protein [Paraburkholderia sp. BL10I2N1]TDN63216.1 universal stress protein family protein [Paraburkholderia sp. BL10I2N1]